VWESPDPGAAAPDIPSSPFQMSISVHRQPARRVWAIQGWENERAGFIPDGHAGKNGGGGYLSVNFHAAGGVQLPAREVGAAETVQGSLGLKKGACSPSALLPCLAACYPHARGRGRKRGTKGRTATCVLVRRIDEVVGQGAGHVLVHLPMGELQRAGGRAHQVSVQALHRKDAFASATEAAPASSEGDR
jgi:hypothetical protein